MRRRPDRGWRGIRLKTRGERLTDAENADHKRVEDEDDEEREAIRLDS